MSETDQEPLPPSYKSHLEAFLVGMLTQQGNKEPMAEVHLLDTDRVLEIHLWWKNSTGVTFRRVEPGASATILASEDYLRAVRRYFAEPEPHTLSTLDGLEEAAVRLVWNITSSRKQIQKMLDSALSVPKLPK